MAEEFAARETRTDPLLDPLYKRLGRNPVALKELRSRMRGGRAFLLITVYLVILSALVGLVYFGFAAASSSYMAPEIRQNMGKSIFGVVVLMELFLVMFISPGLTAGAISSEREQQTFDLLRTTLLPARSLVLGKLLAALSFIFLLLLAAVPLQSFAFLFGGVAIEEFLIANFLLVITALAYTALGLFFSSLLKRTLAATILAYGAAILVVFGLPFLVYSGVILASVILSNMSQIPPIWEMLAVIIVWLFISLNPLATALVTELILIEEQSAIYATLPLSANANFPILSPWISYSLFYFLFSLLLILLSIRLVKRVEV
jgi:ABC-2 type transport system permease protein